MNDMKKLSGILLFALVLALVLPSCGKYEEGPSISLRSKTARIVNEWVVEKYYENAVDVTVAYQTFMPGLVMNIKENGEVVSSYNDQSGSVVTWGSTWEFNSDKSAIIVTTGGVAVTSDIIRLKNDELWLKQTYTVGGVSTIKETHFITK
jgi:hypothetical protein